MCRLIQILVLGLAMLPLWARADVTQLDDTALEALVEQGVAVVDVRRRDEWRSTGVIEGSHLMTFWDAQGRYDLEAWMARLAAVTEPDQPLVLICQTGYRSQVIGQFLDQKAGYKRVHNVTRGIDQWISNGRPTVATK